MLKFYLVEVITYNDGTKENPAIYAYDTLDEAVSRFYTEMGGWMKKENVAHILCVVMNSEGGVYKNEYLTNPITHDAAHVVEEPNI